VRRALIVVGRSVDRGLRITDLHPFALALSLIIGLTVSGCGDASSKDAAPGGSGQPFVSDRLRSRQHADRSVADVTVSTGIEAAATTAIPAAFPLAVGPGRRYLEDAAGKPFLIHGEAAWSLIGQLTRENVDLYLNDRRARGFNTLIISLIEHRFSTNAPANAYGQQPFLTVGDYTTPNEQYFDHADWVVRRAAENGFLVLLVPSYMGAGGGSEGWYVEMTANGPAKLRQYGKYLGKRYRHFTNIIWLHGADYNPPDRSLVTAIAEGIREFDIQRLHTAQCEPDTSPIEYWRGQDWLNVNTVYTYGPVSSAALKEYTRAEGMPFFLIESAYENERNATDQRLRTQAYHAVLSGAAGQIFGNNPIWHFDGPGLYRAPVSWQEAMGSKATQSMTHLRRLLSAVSGWWTLEPDVSHSFLLHGLGSGYDRAVAARTADRSFAIVYVPKIRQITLNLRDLTGPRIAARWYDPANGDFSKVEGSPFPATGSQNFRPDSKNSAGFGDWALILQSQS
jgi:hypothetical protein